VYDGDISVVQIATCKANQEKVIIKSFKRDKLVNRVDLQNKVGGRERLSQGGGAARPAAGQGAIGKQWRLQHDRLQVSGGPSTDVPAGLTHCAGVNRPTPPAAHSLVAWQLVCLVCCR
jgi:hypothetical protein